MSFSDFLLHDWNGLYEQVIFLLIFILVAMEKNNNFVLDIEYWKKICWCKIVNALNHVEFNFQL